MAKEFKPEFVAGEIRAKVDRFAARHFYSRHLTNLCGIASFALLCAFEACGIKAEIVEGHWQAGKKWRRHVWIVCGGKIIDLTYTQFNSRARKVYIVPENDPRYVPKRRHDSAREIAEGTWVGVQLKDVVEILEDAAPSSGERG